MKTAATLLALALMLAGAGYLAVDHIYHFIETPDMTRAAVFWLHPWSTAAATVAMLVGILLSQALTHEPTVLS